MFSRILGCVFLLGSCAVIPLAGQTENPAQNARSLPPASEAPRAAFTTMVRGEGITDPVMPLNCIATISSLSIANNVVTFRGLNSLSPSQEIRISKLNHATYLNGSTLRVLSATSDSFSAAFTHADTPRLEDYGVAFRADCTTDTEFRSNQKLDIFHNSQLYYRQHLSSQLELFSYDSFYPMERDAHYTSMTFNGPSYSWGNHGGWGVQKNEHEELVFNSRGIAQAKNLWCFKHATGDTACGDYVYGYTDGGSTAQSDEGFTVDTREGGEARTYFHGTAGQGATAGTTQLPVVFTSGQDATTDGAFLLDISKGIVSGRISGQDTIVEGTSVHALPVTLSAASRVEPSTGIGIIRTPLPVVAIANVPESIELEVKLTHGSFKPGVACLAGGWYPEQVTVTAAGSANGDTQKVTIIHKNPNPTAETDQNNPSSLWQGGPCGSYLSLDRNLARDGFRTSYPVVGATDSSHIAYAWNVNGVVRQNKIQIYLPPTSLKKLERKDGVVTASFAAANSPYIYNQAPSAVIAGATDPSFNGAVTSPVYKNGQNISLSWKQAGPDSTAASATIDLPDESYGFHLYPGAEILAPRVSGKVQLEPNTVNWAAGDVIENPHNPSFQMRFRMNLVEQHTLPSGVDSHAEWWGFIGAGISANFRPARWINNNPCNMYVGCGGTLAPIIWTIHHGPYGVLQRVDSAPMNGGALFNIGCDLLGCDHPAPYSLFEMQNGRILYDPATSTVSTAAFSAVKLNAAEAKMDKLSLSNVADGCLGVVDHVLTSAGRQAHSAPCISGITWRGGSGLTVQQSGDPASPTFTIVPEPGYYIPTLANGKGGGGEAAAPAATAATVAAISAGEANSKESAICASGYSCTASRGRLNVTSTGGTVAGKVARVNVRLAAGQVCTATQNGGTAFLGIGSGGESATGFDITSGVAISGRVVIDYFCR